MRRPGSGSHTAVELMVQPVEQPALDREDVEALHDEIARLPGSFRLPVVLCYFEGLTLDEAASRLRWPSGTVHSRLARARDKLRRGLTRRGVALPAAVLATALTAKSASASVSSSLCDITTTAAMNFAAGQAASSLAASLAHEVLKALFVNNLKLVTTSLLLLAAFATGAGFLAQSLAMKDEPKKTTIASQLPLAAKPDNTPKVPAPGRMFVVGRVLDPQGKPVPGAKVMVHTRLKRPESVFAMQGLSPAVIGHTDADGSGQFRLDAPERHRRETMSSWPSPWHLATESVGPSSTLTPISPTPKSGCNPSK